MASGIVALTCDCCGKEVEDRLYIQRCSRDTAAASFRYDVCLECAVDLEEAEPEVRDLVYKRAMATHALRYSEPFGVFVAAWFGIEMPGPLEPLAKAA